MLTICTFLWGTKFNPSDVAKLAAGVKRHLQQPYEFALINANGLIDPGRDVNHVWPLVDAELTKIKGCFARLRLFDPAWQKQYAISDRLVCIDLDTVITGPLDPLFDRPEPFVIMQGGNSANPNPYGGALMMLRPGAHANVWSQFSLDAASKVPFHEFPDDQSWLHAKIPNAAGWQVGQSSGVYCFRKPGWPDGDDLPAGARMVTFRGNNQPAKYEHLDWVKENSR